MAHDDTAPTTDAAPEAPSRAATGLLCLLLFVGSFALMTVGFDSDGFAGAALVTAGILAFALAFAIPTTILPALEDRDRR
ncbi:hypothetical protein [Cellulomonas dongxiuzhuiae]|uniref:Uncharacterized protein n=1 Tax=Cellulomonas dongxiuzhuiae TaxID=2819979 RepID=A0ABX8GMP5_9CELL|nr:hypothetical protein [Cellulomonas dongxiuzhuiae]MBO3087727.1 hypothetical protein [Cellulomonas dongxiuzhuiae]MBO3095913.1 hypothetical protein [Cellulomonas dongxiuzhuiae]QWC17208.1 hypothetical protein KKR89_06345 [Cellulomonas dongxiuzhuiae]